MIDLIVEQTILYANRDKNMHNFKTDQNEMKKFLGLIIISGYHSLPSENDLWSTADDMIMPIFSSTMSKDRFRLMKRYLHIADNSSLAQSKVAKILPLYELLKKKTVCNLVFYISFWALMSQWFRIVDFTVLGSTSKISQWNLAIKYGCCAAQTHTTLTFYCGKDTNRVTPLGSHVV